MFNIDYSTRRTFLMSLGIALIFLGFLLNFSIDIFLVERLDNAMDYIKFNSSNEDQLIKNDLTMNNLIKIKKRVKPIEIFSWVLIIGGGYFLTEGLLTWRKEGWREK